MKSSDDDSSLGTGHYSRKLRVMHDIVTMLIVVASLAWAYFGFFEYGIWKNRGPGAGFFPFVAGLAAALIALHELFSRDKTSKSLPLKNILPAFALAIFVFLSKYIGTLIALPTFVTIWVLVIEKKPFSKAALSGVIVAGFIYLIFEAWLKVPLP